MNRDIYTVGKKTLQAVLLLCVYYIYEFDKPHATSGKVLNRCSDKYCCVCVSVSVADKINFQYAQKFRYSEFSFVNDKNIKKEILKSR